jgi:AraC-like DNA-binding protein
MLHPDLLQRLCRARESLRSLDPEPRRLRDVAREAGMSQFHFIRLYKSVFGETPHQQQSATQIKQAKRLLLLTDRSVTAICMEIGFSSVGSFSTLFRQRTGESPSGFRRRHRRDGPPLPELPREMVPGCLTLMGRIPAKSAISEKRAARASAKLPSLHA